MVRIAVVVIVLSVWGCSQDAESDTGDADTLPEVDTLTEVEAATDTEPTPEVVPPDDVRDVAPETAVADSADTNDVAPDTTATTEVAEDTAAVEDTTLEVEVLPEPDVDGDGWRVSDGDCCDSVLACSEPAMVNPGAFEILGNGVDDDCDPTTPDDRAPADCGPGPLTTPTTALDLANALELCQSASESDRRWGVLEASVTLADGTSRPLDLQLGVLSAYGPNVLPQRGATLAALGTGTARDANDPGFVPPQSGPGEGQTGSFDAQTESGLPAAWAAANGGVIEGCAPCVGAACARAFDSVSLNLRLRVPTNAQSFSYRLKYYTSEYPELVCAGLNDQALTLLEGGPADVPADTNIAVDEMKTAMSVNNQYLDVCFPPSGSPPGVCDAGTLELIGTGMGGFDGSIKDGAGTPWLTNEAPVTPGSIITLRFVIFDAGDHNVDSLLLLDRFRWSAAPAAVALRP